MKKAIMTLLMTLYFLTSAFSANTSLRISSFTRNIKANYDLNGNIEITQSITLKHKGEALDYFLAISPGSSGLWNNRVVINGGNQLSYQIYRDSSKTDVLKSISDNPSANEIITGSFAQSGSFQFSTYTYTIYVPPGQFNLAGVYDDSFDVSLYSGNLSTYTLEGTKTHSLSVTMPTSLELSITPSGVPFDDTSFNMNMNFGILNVGSSRSADAVIRTNTPYSIFILSEKGGKLTHTDPLIADIVPYTFTFNGNTVDLTSPTAQQIITGATVTSWEGTRYPMNVTIGDYGMASEGYYSDNLTITIQAQ